MYRVAKSLTVACGAIAMALAVVGPAAADVILLETFSRTRTRQEAVRIATDINQGRIPGWSMAEVEYDTETRLFVVVAARQDQTDPDVPDVEIPDGPQPPLPPLPAPPLPAPFPEEPAR